MQNTSQTPTLPTTTRQGALATAINAPDGPKPDLDSTAKAAIVVRLLLNEGADIPLEDLPDNLQSRLIQKMGSMGLVDRTTLFAVVEEFADILDGVGLSFPNGLAETLDVMDGKISPQTAARLRKEAGVRQAGDPWDRLRALTVEELAKITNQESTEVAAVLLSKLDTPKAASLLGLLPGGLARRITYAIGRTEEITPQAVDRIGLSLACQLDSQPPKAFEEAPEARIGAILNQSAAKTRDDMLTGLDETDSKFATNVRNSIFIFEHIPERVAPRDVPGIVRDVDPEDMVSAIAAATDGKNKDSAEFLLTNMPSRLADNLRDEVQEKGDVKPQDGEAAMNRIIAVIRTREQAGDITLITRSEPEANSPN